MKLKEVLLPALAILVIGALTGYAMTQGHDGQVIYWSIIAITGLAGYQLRGIKTGQDLSGK